MTDKRAWYGSATMRPAAARRDPRRAPAAPLCVLAAVVLALVCTVSPVLAVGLGAVGLFVIGCSVAGLTGKQMLFAGAVGLAVLNQAPGIHDATLALGRFSPFLYPVLLLSIFFFVTCVVTGGETSALLPVAALLVLTLASALVFGGKAFQSWALTLFGPALVFLGIQASTARDRRTYRHTFEVVLFCAVAVAAVTYLAVAGVAGLDPRFVIANHTDTEFHALIGRFSYGNPNNAAVVFVTALAFGARGFVRSRGTAPRAAYATLAGLAALCSYVTGSRGAFVAMVLVLLLVVLPRGGGTTVTPRARSGILVVVGLATLAGVFLYLSNPSVREGASISVRQLGRAAGLHAMVQRPILGSGPGNSVEAVQASASVTQSLVSPDFGSAHDVFINFGVDTGIPALLLLIALVVQGARRAYRRGLFEVIPLAAFLVMIEFAGTSMLNSFNPAWAYVFWVCLGFAWSGEGPGAQRGQALTRSEPLALAGTATAPAR